MNQTHYIVDNNALLRIGRRRRATPFFKTSCHLTEDVAYEAGWSDVSAAHTSIEVTAPILVRLLDVMDVVPPGDTDLIDLYNNKGMADPVMVATLLELEERNAEMLLPDSWVLVTADKALSISARQYGLEVIGPDALAVRIDAATPPEA